jgi:Zn-dependent metalloprotease
VQAVGSSTGGSAPPQSIIPPFLQQPLPTAEGTTPGLHSTDQSPSELDESLRQQRQEYAKSLATEKVAVAPVPEPAHLNRLIYTCDHGTRLPGTIVRREDKYVAPDDVAVDECYVGLGNTFALFWDIFQRNSLDDAGMNLLGSVHYGRLYNNAFWNGRQMVFGDGDGHYFNGFTSSVDVIGHELTHGVVSYTCNLDYFDQPGAMNESLADVFGSMVKQYYLKQTADKADWLIGEGLFTEAVSGSGDSPAALRSLKAPGTAYDDPVLGKDPQPAHMDHFVETSQDNGGVHINSGIPNRAFYLIATALGGCSWERAGTIWYAAMTDLHLPQTASFIQFADLTLKKAAVYGDDARNIVESAWRKVGVKS